MPVDYQQIGLRLKAHRIGAGLSPEQVADQLGISRAALYNYERGSTPIKVESLERMAALLDVSLPSLLGAGTEYFSTAIAYFERLRQIEGTAERITLFYEPITFLLTSEDFSGILRTMLVEGLPAAIGNKARAIKEIERLLVILQERRVVLRPGGPAIAGLIGLTEVRRLLRTGLVGTYAMSEKTREKRRLLAVQEVERTADLMAREPLGIQIGVIDDTLPNQTFEICRLRDRSSLVAISAYRLGEFPNVRLGVASITGAADAVALYEKLVGTMWQRALKGTAGATLLRNAIAEVKKKANRN
jgi:transcriptional regulator with XRE-family HTH domain